MAETYGTRSQWWYDQAPDFLDDEEEEYEANWREREERLAAHHDFLLDERRER
jgi:hypothetical protein